MTVFIMVGILIGLIMKRNPFTIFQQVKFLFPSLFIISILVQVIIEIFVNDLNKNVVTIIFNLAILLIIAALFLNRHIAGVWWILAGTCMNLFAVFVHKGLMPVSEAAMKMAGLEEYIHFSDDSRHQLMGDSMFWWLGDWIPFYSLWGNNYVISLGDLIVGIGLTIFIIKNSARGRLQ